jgi:hypothetical protein
MNKKTSDFSLFQFLILLTLWMWSFCGHSAYKITDYQRIFFPVFAENGEYMVAIRVFKRDETPSFLLVNPTTLRTRVAPVDEFALRDRTATTSKGHSTYSKLKNTLYHKLLYRYASAPEQMENQGITHALNKNTGNILSIDLCPSSVPFEKEFFATIVALSLKKGPPIPIAIAISGLWLIDHPDEFQWLVEMQQLKKLQITWVNHSFTHIFYHDLPYEKNFLRSPLINLDAEISLTEQYLLENGETPSVFFRFPGLVSGKKLVRKIQQYGLIPLGADAWIAKSERVTPGGVILVHGNGNEHVGIVELQPKLKDLNIIDIHSALNLDE